MKLPKRFTLSHLLIVTLLVALIFGYAIRRKQLLIAEVERLSDYTSVIEVSDDWFWPTVTPTAIILLTRDENGQLSNGDEIVGTTEAQEFYEAAEKRLYVIGVKDIRYGLVNREMRDGQVHEEIVSSPALNELMKRFSK